MAWTVELFEAPPPDANGRPRSTEKKPSFTVEGKDYDEARKAAFEQLRGRGFTVRSVNRVVHDDQKLVATVNAIPQTTERPKATITPKMLRR